MNFLKSFENYKIDLSKYKKYVLSKEDETYYIDEILGLNKDGNVIDVINYYTYNIDHNDDIQVNTHYNDFGEEVHGEKSVIRKNFLNNYAIYTSDVLDDCLNDLKAILDSNKYNI